MTLPDLPITEALPALLDALGAHGRAVLQAPPGAGKTTLVPLAMHDAGLTAGRTLILEPRRLAARAAAERMADTLGEAVGQTVGYRIRGEAKVSKATRIEVVTEGILTRMIQSDPSLAGIGAVIFDEFHERSLNADLGLALAWEVRGALREDLILLVMSATLDAGPVAAMLGAAPVITSEGRAFPVEIRWLDRPLPKELRFESAAADLVAQAVAETAGGVLVFLPGEGEIRRVEGQLKDRLPGDCTLHPLFGAMDFAAQRAAIAPALSGRKVVLATAIAETSLTIQDIRVVVDCGRARRARFDPGWAMSRLVTERVTKAEAEQRRGRAGRLAEGICYRMWTKGEEGGMQAYPPAEIASADLAGLALDLALWGAVDTDGMAFLTPPNPGAFAEARALLADLGALDIEGRITAHGKALAALPLHPRLGHMLTVAGMAAAPLAALLADRDPLRGAASDLMLRKRALEGGRDTDANAATLARIRAEAKRLANAAPASVEDFGWPEMAALAYPDRIGLRRPGDAPRYILSGGKGAILQEADPLASARLIVALDLDGDATEARIRLAAILTDSELRGLYPDRVSWQQTCCWSRREGRVIAREQEMFGALALSDRPWSDAPPEAVARAALDGVRELGLPFSDPVRRFQARVELSRAGGADLPDVSDAALLDSMEDWLLPHLSGVRTAADIRNLDLADPLRARLTWEQLQQVDRLAPSHFTTPMDRRVPIDYGGEAPEIAVRLQEMFGTTEHPTVVGQPLRITLLSPAGRPVQTTMDLPGFWASSYTEVRKDMRGRYPKHPWPEDPTAAEPTLRAKPRRA